MSTDTLLFECVGLKAGGKFPIENTGRGQDVSPEFLVKNLSPAAKTLAVTLEDIRHPLADLEHSRHRKDCWSNPRWEDRSQPGKCQAGTWLWLVQICWPETTQRQSAFISLYNLRP